MSEYSFFADSRGRRSTVSENMVYDDDQYSRMIERDGEIVGSVEIKEIKKFSQKYGVKTGTFCTLIDDPKN